MGKPEGGGGPPREGSIEPKKDVKKEKPASIEAGLLTSTENVLDGWETANSLASDVSNHTVKKIAEFYRGAHPDWFRGARRKDGKEIVYYHPDLAAIIRQRIRERGEQAPKGWLTKGALANLLDTGSPTIERRAMAYRTIKPEWFHDFLNVEGGIFEHYHPDLVDLISKEVREKSEPAPEGWLTYSATAKLLKRHIDKIKELANSYRSSHPNWFALYSDRSHHPAEHLHPDLVTAIKQDSGQEISHRELAPEGWLSTGGVRRMLGESGFNVSYDFISVITNKYREAHPEWFKVFFDRAGNINTEHFHPDLVSQIKKEIEARSEPPSEGWKTINELHNLSKVNARLIKSIAERFKKSNPTWFKYYLTPRRLFIEHYHPELAAKILQEVADRATKAPEGWLTNNALANELGVSYKAVGQSAEQYRSEHPSRFAQYLDKVGKPAEHYNPELSDLIRLDIESKKKPAPDGWKTNYAVASELDMDFAIVEQAVDYYRENHPDWFAYYQDKIGNLREHYHPLLVEKIVSDMRDQLVTRKARAEKFEPAPNGWLTKGGLAKLMKAASETIETLIRQFRDTKPEWFHIYLDDSLRGNVGRAHEHLHPELVDFVKKELAKRGDPAPEGWFTKTGLAELFKVAEKTVSNLAAPYRLTNADWFHNYLDGRTILTEHYGPELVSLIGAAIERRGEKAPNGWQTNSAAAKLLKIDGETASREAEKFRASNPEWFKEYLDKRLVRNEHYHPDLIAKIKESIDEKRRPAPEGWVAKQGLMSRWSAGERLILGMARKFGAAHPEWFGSYYRETKKFAEYYHPDLVKMIEEAVEARSEAAPSGWSTNTALAHSLGAAQRTTEKIAEAYRSAHPDWFQFYIDSSDHVNEHFHPDLIDLIKKEYSARGEVAPQGWVTNYGLAKTISVGEGLLKGVAESYRGEHPEFFRFYLDDRNRVREHYHPDLVILIRKAIEERKSAPQGWQTLGQLVELLGVANRTIFDRAKAYREGHPEWFAYYTDRINKLAEHYHPDLVAKIKEDVADLVSGRDSRKEQDELRKNLEKFANEIAGESSADGQKFRSLIGVIGASRCLDLLYKFRPDYRSLRPEYIKGVIAEYLGDYLITPPPFRLEDVGIAVEAETLSELTFQEGLYENLKDNCLRYYFEQRRAGKHNSNEIIYGYLGHITDSLAHLKNKDLDDIIERVILYYNSVLKDFHKPEGFVAALNEDREFPDINQRINMKELADKKRLLIADEMGLGKSASVIMAKEQLGVKCAVIVAPSNVLDTWQQYLSEENPAEPKKGGYFKKGKTPRVLRVENQAALKNVTANGYDYIIISQERLSINGYVDALVGIDYGMLIADEFHKVKSIKGERAPQLLRLAEKIEGDDKYLAILSGTPVPNKVGDLAMALKLLYPDKFATMDNRELTQQIVRGDIIDLRSLLIPRLQMKDLEEGVEMPEFKSETIEIELSQLEKDVYEVLLEDDELTPSEKMQILRQFLLNPELIDATPGIHGSKIEATGEALRKSFQEHNKVVMFVNDYVDGIIRGGTTIIEKLGLPQDVEVRVIHGEIKDKERAEIQDEVDNSTDKMLIIISGKTADVGVNFSSADNVFMYNEPWTEYQKRQEIARVYRYGVEHDVTSTTLIAKGTIEEGIHQYILKKYVAIEKLLRGIPLSEMDQEIIEHDEGPDEPDKSANQELADYYFSSWDKMMKFFGYVKEIGEENFTEFLKTRAKDYAAGYVNLGNRSYQANANRVVGTVIHELAREQGQDIKALRILDLASGPEMLKQHIGDEYQDRVFSLDINAEHFKGRETTKAVQGSLTRLPFVDESFDYSNLSLSLHYTGYVPSKGKLERLQVLSEMNRTLKVGGKLVVNLIYSLELKDLQQFEQAVDGLGFKVINDYTGDVAVGDQYRSRVVTLEKVHGVDPALTLEDISEQLGKEKREGLKFTKTDSKVKDSRKIITEFAIGGKHFNVNFNKKDREVWEEEQALLLQGKQMRDKYGSVVDIPRQEIIDNNFVRIKSGKKYFLFKKLTKGTGVVLIR